MFNEENTVENYIRDQLCGQQTVGGQAAVRERPEPYGRDSIGLRSIGLGWEYIYGPDLPRDTTEVIIEKELREALIRLNPEIAARPDRADEVIYRLRAILLSVRSDGLVRANEAFAEWLRGEKSMPFGPNNQHVPVRLLDFEQADNRYIVSTQVTYREGSQTRRFDLVLYINGLPLVVGEAKTPVRPAVTWFDGADQVHNDYEVNVPAFFAPNVFSFASEGKTYRFGSVRMPLDMWAPWRNSDEESVSGLNEVAAAVTDMLPPAIILDILQNFTIFATDKKHRKIKLMCRYQQYHTTNQIVRRVVAGRIKKGLIWHFQGSGKSLLMVFAAQKLRLHPTLKNPTVLIVVDRVDLDTQITATFNAADVPNIVATDSRQELQTMLARDTRKIIITTIHKFAEADSELNRRDNIILFVDEAHRTQEGDMGRRMRQALPNAFFFGLTGTPINKRDRNTFWAFGADEDENGYMSRYSFEESIRDKATLPLHFEARLVKLRIDREAIDEAYANLTGHMSEDDQANLAKQAAKMAVLVKSPERVQTIVADIVQHYQETVEPNGFKAQIVTFDRESCILYKQAMDDILLPEASEVIISAASGDPDEWKKYDRSKEAEEKILDRFRDPADPLKFIIVTAKLLTGFDAPILQPMYLDKPMKEHNLLQAICRTNRPYPGKTHGLIVDYLGVFDDVAQALDFDEKSVQKVISNLDELKQQLPEAMAACLAYFPGVDRSVAGYEGLLTAQEKLPTDEQRDEFAADYSVLARLWEALSPAPFLSLYEADYRWLTQVYESLKPPSGHGKLLWHTLGAKTLNLIHENVHVETVRDDLETLIIDAEFLSELEASQDPQKMKEIEIKIAKRLQKHKNNPTFIELGLRLEKIKNQLEQGIINSLEYLRYLLQIVREVLQAEKEVNTKEEQRSAKAALTELFYEIRTDQTPAIVEKIVNEIDEIVRHVRFPEWQQTTAGEREVQKALRGVLLKYQLHKDHDLFDKAYAYIKEYY